MGNSLARVCLVAGTCLFAVPPVALGDPVFRADIRLDGDANFVEDARISGQILWTAVRDFSGSEFHLTFNFRTCPPWDDSFRDPVITDLRLLDEAGAVYQSVPCTPWMALVSIVSAGSDPWFPPDPPGEWWVCSASVWFDQPRSFGAGQVIGISSFSCAGEDSDDVVDENGFSIGVQINQIAWIGGVIVIGEEVITGSMAIIDTASDTRILNPEPVPEPGSTSFLALGGVGVLIRRRS